MLFVRCWGQATTGPQPTLTLTATGTVRHGTADANGEYQFLHLTPGDYTLKASREGFTAA